MSENKPEKPQGNQTSLFFYEPPEGGQSELAAQDQESADSLFWFVPETEGTKPPETQEDIETLIKRERARVPAELDSSVRESLLSNAMKRFKDNYGRIPSYQHRYCSWEIIEERLKADNYKKLQLAMAMQNGGELFGIDKEGKALFKDEGTEPVRYYLDGDGGKWRECFNGAKADAICPIWAGYNQIASIIAAQGYEFFATEEEARMAEKYTGKPFVVRGNEFITSYIKKDMQGRIGKIAYQPFFGGNKTVCFYREKDGAKGNEQIGVVRLLRV